MNYRPICDTWWLARSKVKYYGAYPSGFLKRARNLLGVQGNMPVLHVCSGKVVDYPFRGFGPKDKTVDIRAELKPDFVMDVRKELPMLRCKIRKNGKTFLGYRGWPAILADPPYTPVDHAHYDISVDLFPNPRKLLELCLNHVRIGGRVGILHYEPPSPPSYMKVELVASIGVLVGYNNHGRFYTVYERLD